MIGKLRLIDENGDPLCDEESCHYESFDGALRFIGQVEMMVGRNSLAMNLIFTGEDGVQQKLPINSHVACLGARVTAGIPTKEQSDRQKAEVDARERRRVASEIMDELAPRIVAEAAALHAANELPPGELSRLLRRYAAAQVVADPA